ncbi:VCBS repeat-containing protein [Cecembia rubra]|uniref:FG-GAP repeat protein n=1 Tax=Cecembia rubra TaxID=1485585 RepID=A0A2P8DXN6_9BACT|nr:VCBS repeat-containing protein [Cecembia rubra]PSL01988.1 FG-GAP repeat protein [Cecembia rubra]
MRRVYSFLLIIIGVSCSTPKQETLFTLLSAEETGIDFSNNLISTGEMNILEYLYFYNGGGVALGDINNDGLVDIYFASNQGENKLYLNRGNFRFEDITLSAEVTGEGGWSTGVTMVDVNGDGLLDIYVCQVGDYKGLKGKNKLYINQGDLTFTEEAEKYGVDFIGFSTHAVFFDYDNDGDLDMYLLNHSIKKPEVFSHADTKFTNQDEKGGDKLFKSLVAQGEQRMVEVSQEAGILSSSLGFGLGVGIADVNGDGWMDIYVSNDFTEDDYLYINKGNGTFVESLKEYIENTSRYSMGNDLADINNDGLPDIFTTDMLPRDPEIWMKSVGEDKQEVFDIKRRLGYGDQYVRNHLQLNRGDGKFSEIGLLTGTYATDWSWSPLIFDMDNDGFKDIHVTNGIVKRPNDLDFIQYSQEPTPELTEKEVQKRQIDMLPTVKLANFAFKNKGNLEFEQVAKRWGLDQLSYSNGSAYADLDNDGDLDLVVNNTDQPAFIYRNNAEKSGNSFVQLELKGDRFNLYGIGAQVWVLAAGETYYQVLSTSRGFQSGTSTVLTFGLGNADHIDEVYVIWGAGEVENYGSLTINKRHQLVKGQGGNSEMPKGKISNVLEVVDLGLDWKHDENLDFDEFRREYLMPRRFATEGPALAVGDINGDGLEDIYLGGAKGQAGALYLQHVDGKFVLQQNPIFEQLKMAEDVVAEFIDLNRDGFLDLYVGSGGNESISGEVFNFDRVFINDGKGNLRFSINSLPPIGENTSTIAFHDVNGDGAIDIFVGSSVVTGNYGAKPRSYLLINDGKGKFIEMTPSYFGEDFRPGMVQRALWNDINGDGEKELILTGEWMPVVVYRKQSDGTYKETAPLAAEGWYYGMEVFSLDGEDKGLLLGNLGLNSKLKVSEKEPAQLFHGDFDGNGQEDPLLFHFMEGYLVPFATRDDLIRQIPNLKRRHESYVKYAQLKEPKGLLAKEQMGQASISKAKEFRSLFIDLGNKKKTALPIEIQFSPIRDFVVFSSNGSTYVMGVGNFSGFRTDYGKKMAQPFVLLRWTGDEFVHESLSLQAKHYWGEYRHIKKIRINGEEHLIGVRNNGKPVFFRLKP